MSDSIEPGNRVCVGLPTGEVCALSADMTLTTNKGPVEARNLPQLWRNGFFEWVELPTLMSVSRPTEHEWEEDESRDMRGKLTVRHSHIAYVAEEQPRE